MKLKDWLRKKDYDHVPSFPPPHSSKPTETKGLHVIGTCGECKEQDNCGILQTMWEEGSWGEGLLEEFGCIHFEAKGEK